MNKKLSPQEQYIRSVYPDISKKIKRLEEENEFLRKNNENLDETYFETWEVCEKLKENSNYALKFVDNVYWLIDTKDNVINKYETNSKGIIDNGTQKKLKALEIIKENLNIDEILLAVKGVCKATDYDLVKEVLL